VTGRHALIVTDPRSDMAVDFVLKIENGCDSISSLWLQVGKSKDLKSGRVGFLPSVSPSVVDYCRHRRHRQRSGAPCLAKITLPFIQPMFAMLMPTAQLPGWSLFNNRTAMGSEYKFPRSIASSRWFYGS